MSDNLFTIKEAAKYLKVHWQTIRNYIKKGQIKSSKVGKNIRIKQSELQRFVSGKKPTEKYEYEIRFTSKKREKIENKLLKLGAKIIYHGHVIDHWFVPDEVEGIDQKNELFESGKGFGLRIREQDNGYTGKITTSLEVKRLVEPYKHEACVEQEIEVENYDKALSFLNLIDQKEFCVVDKDRLIYKFKEFKIVIDDIKNFKTGVEIEAITAKHNKKLINKMRQLARDIGLDIKKELTDKSAVYLYMKKNSKF